ncbi:MAG: ice-binding family protein [Acidimicrobiales bacterium]
MKMRGRHAGATLVVLILAPAILLLEGTSANAAIVATVPLATAGNYAVLAGSTVTNTGNSTLDGSLGLWPGTSITGFPPGKVLPPGTIDNDNAAAQQAQSDLTAGYTNAAGRPLDATTSADLANLNLPPGVYAGPSKGALGLSGPLTLNGGGDASAVFIFQTNSTLITGSGTTISLINGAQECNVFWQVGSSATLGSGSVFVGNILALTSITVNNSVTVHGRALARNGAVTLDNDTFTRPTCAAAPVTTTTAGPTATTGAPTVTTAAPTATTTAPTATTTAPTATTAAPAGGAGGGGGGPGGGGGGVTPPGGGGGVTPPGVPPGPGGVGVVGPPRTGGAPMRTGSSPWRVVLLACLGGVATLGAGIALASRRRGNGAAAPR